MAENEAHVFVPSTPVVGFEYDAWEIKDRLIGSSERRLDVIFIVGRGGIGKTTLALKVFNEPIIAYHFDIRAWITVSQVYQKRDLLLGILSSPDIVPSGDIHRMSNGTLGEVLYKSLSLYRYLIVMDDIWDTQAWDDLKRCFPNNNSGSRILLTSRIREVALHAKPDRTPYDMRFRSNEESWDLLQEKIFHTKICPPELIEVGKEIAEKCWGLPLAIVVIGGLLSKTEKNEYSSWKQIAESMNSYDPYESLVAVLEVTYNYLPNHLKPCFLYFGAFPEGYDIPVFKLIWLWTAEGFVKTNGDKSLEETAMDYLVDLIERSLILTSSERSSNGEVKSCGIHDVLRDLCLRKAEEENFMQIIDENHHQVASSSLYSSSSPIANNLRGLCIRSSFVHNFPFESFPDVYSIFCYNRGWSPSMSIISQNLKLLRVLDFLPVVFYSYPNEIEQLVHLRYLALRARFNVLPASIVNIHNLETLIIKGLGGSITVYADIYQRMKLRHLHIDPSVSWGLDDSLLSSHLQTISTPYFDGCNLSSLKSTPNLRKLRCVIYNNECNPSFHGLVPRLETLNMCYDGARRDIYLSDLPVSLKKLTLSKFWFNWNVIKKLAGLPNLEVLKLLDNAFDGDWLDSDLLPFPKLKFLKLESLNISRWEALRHHFPSLQRLVLIRCINLDEIPSDIGHIPTLETIELTRSSAADSAKKILDEQYEIGNDRLKILIVQERKWRSNDGNMLIRVRRGINLAVRGTIRIDPFIGITMGKQKLKTLVVVNNCNPEWNDELTFYVANPNIPIRLTVYDNLILNFKMGEAEIDIKPYLECLKMGLHNHPTGTKVYRVQPNRTNCLAEESCIVWNNGKMTQDMILRLRNVECRKVEVQIEWIELLGSKVLKG